LIGTQQADDIAQVTCITDWTLIDPGNDVTDLDAGPLAETILLGNVAAKAGAKLEWDGEKFEVTNVGKANNYLRRKYRSGWIL